MAARFTRLFNPRPPADPTPDAALALAYRAGSNPAGDTLLLRHFALLRALVRKVRIPAGRAADTDDLLQVARIAFLRAARTWNPASPTRSKLTTYATICVRRAVLRELGRGRHAALPQAATDAASPDALADPDGGDRPAPFAVLDPARLSALLDCLTARQRAAIQHRYGLDGREPAATWAALARRLRVSEAHARRLHDEGLERLRAVLAGG